MPPPAAATTTASPALDPALTNEGPAVEPLPGCLTFLKDQDVEKACGLSAGTVHGESDPKQACLLRFKSPGRGSIVLQVREHNDANNALRRFGKTGKKASSRDKYAKLSGVGAGSHAFTKSKGEGEKLRTVRVVDFVADRFTAQVRESHHPDAKALCDTAKLPEIAKLVVERLGATGPSAPPAAPAPATAKPDTTAEARPEGKAPSAAPAPKPAEH